VNPEIARALEEEESSVLRELKTIVRRKLSLKPDAHLHHEQFDLMAV